jgi:predicted CopG family antitoxin
MVYSDSMATKPVALDTEAYDLLKRQKKPGESFSAVVKRLAVPRRPLTDFIGIWKDLPQDELKAMKREIRRGRDLDRRRLARLLKEEG